MNLLLDKLVLLIFCTVLYLQNVQGVYLVVPVITAIAVGSLNGYFDNEKVHLACYAMYLGICFYDPVFFYFIPLVCYDVFLAKWQWCVVTVFIAAGVHFSDIPFLFYIMLFMMIGLSLLMKYRTTSIEKLKSEYTDLRDSAKELSIRLEAKNKELLEKQDYEVNLATLNERNRIAREIHDSVGHLLSSSILQIGALMVTCTDAAARENLRLLKDTLSRGMDSIRNSIHNLYEDSVDLYIETNTLIKNFNFCPVTLDYDIQSNPDKKYKYALIFILKESLSNIIKHSDATFVSVSLREHPALYQLVVKDNGTKKSPRDHSGLGLKNIKDRVEGLGGIVNISDNAGFTVFISVPKE